MPVEGSIFGINLYMAQLKGELCYLGVNHGKMLKNVDFTNFFNLKKSQNRAKSLPFQI